MGGQAWSASNAVSRRAAAAPAEPASGECPPCILVNPRSFSASRGGLAERAARLGRAYGADVIRAADSAEIDAAMDLLIARQQQRVVLVAGDGTLRAVVDRLAAAAASVPRPHLLVLGGGRANLVSRDFGERGNVLRKLETALQSWRDGIPLGTEVRHVLEVVQPPAPRRLGFFLGAGLVDYAIRACRRDRMSGGMLWQSKAATYLTLLRLTVPAMLGRLEPLIDDLHVRVPGREALHDAAHLLIATTLQRRQGAVDPYAARGRGVVRFTAVAARGMGFWARLPLVVTGRFTRGMDAEHGYLSGSCDALEVEQLSTYTLDGEEFTADPARPVMIRQGPAVTFLAL